MISFFIWMLVKIIVLVSLGYWISQAVKDTRANKQSDKLENEYNQLLTDNFYEHYHVILILQIQYVACQYINKSISPI